MSKKAEEIKILIDQIHKLKIEEMYEIGEIYKLPRKGRKFDLILIRSIYFEEGGLGATIGYDLLGREQEKDDNDNQFGSHSFIAVAIGVERATEDEILEFMTPLAREKGFFDRPHTYNNILKPVVRGLAYDNDWGLEENDHCISCSETTNVIWDSENGWQDVVEFLDEEEETEETFDFGEALRALKEGSKVTRSGWNGEGMFLYYVPANNYKAITEVAKRQFGDKIPYQAYIALKTVENTVTPWNASQTDMLAEDWIIIEDE